MEAEARPLIEQLKAEEQRDFFAPLPCRLYTSPFPSAVPLAFGEGSGVRCSIVTTGRQHDRDLIGCEAAALATTMAIQRLSPDLIISSGTCGGWARKGMAVGQVYIANGAMFHDRRVPGDNAWDTIEDEYIDANGGQLKEMEGASVAFVCSVFGVPVMLVKAVTNLRDAPSDDISDFQTHLKAVSQRLCQVNMEIIKALAEL